jgi:hypothetical protein
LGRKLTNFFSREPLILPVVSWAVPCPGGVPPDRDTADTELVVIFNEPVDWLANLTFMRSRDDRNYFTLTFILYYKKPINPLGNKIRDPIRKNQGFPDSYLPSGDAS